MIKGRINFPAFNIFDDAIQSSPRTRRTREQAKKFGLMSGRKVAERRGTANNEIGGLAQSVEHSANNARVVG
ncbi:MAG: hypothetical protein Q8P67_12640, partial [archaeon]|nr:hypothetical protein [archaeon]